MADEDVIELGEPLAYVGEDGIDFTNPEDYMNMMATMMSMGYIHRDMMPSTEMPYTEPSDLYYSWDGLGAEYAHPEAASFYPDSQSMPSFPMQSPLPPITTNQFPTQAPPTQHQSDPTASHTTKTPSSDKKSNNKTNKKKKKKKEGAMPARRSPSYNSTRSRSRGRSPYTPYSRSRGRSHSRGSRYSDTYYSDSFDSDGSRGRRRRSPSARGNGNSGAPKSKVVVPKFKTAIRKVGGKKGTKKSGAATTTPRPTMGDVVTKRMLSARRLKINELKNEIDILMKSLEEIRRENKSLKRDNVLQTKQLDKFQDQEGELPTLLDSHTKEVRALKEQIRKWRERHDRTNKSLKNTEDELNRTQKKVKKLQNIADDKKLEEREELSRRLGRSEQDLDDKNNRIQQLERHIENLEKSHRREIVTEMKKHAATKIELETIQADYEYTKIHLRDKEKELEVRNIYQNRIAMAKRAGSVSSLPALEPPARYQPPPRSPDVSPRRRAQEFEQKRRDEQKTKTKQLSVSNFDAPNSASKVPPITKSHQSSHLPIEANNEIRSSTKQPIQSRQEIRSTEQSNQKNVTTVAKQPAKQQPSASKKEPQATRRSNEADYDAPTTQSRKSQEHKPQAPKAPATPQFQKEDSWDAIVKKQQNISGAKTNAVSHDSLEDSFNKSSQDSTFVKVQQSQSFFATEIPDQDDEGLEDEDRRRREQEEAEEEEQRKRRRVERQREEEERRGREQREREEKQERDRRAREERERYDREQQRQQQEEREAREREERRSQENEERERKYRQEAEDKLLEQEAEERARIAREQEKQRLETDTRAAEERRKKDLLLQKMKELDGGGSSNSPKPLFGGTSVAKKPAAASGSLFDSNSGNGGDFFLTSGADPKNNKEYKKTDENLYRGLPAKKQSRSSNLFGDEGKKDNPLFPNKGSSLFDDGNDDLDFGGYNPTSFGGPTKSSRPAAQDNNTWKTKDSSMAGSKSNVLDDLFGNSGNKNTKPADKKQLSIFDDDDDMFKSPSQKPKPAIAEKRSSGFPWENENNTNKKTDKILPLRPRADHSTIHNKPTVRAISDFDDDLEEVML